MTTSGDQLTPETSPEPGPETAPESIPEPVVIAGAPSQMLARLLVGVIVFGVVVSGAYIVTRRSEAPGVKASAVPPQVPAPAPVPAVLPVLTPPAASAPKLDVKAPTVTAASDISPEETKGYTFLQVGAVDRAEAANYVRGLGTKGFTARIGEGPQPNVARILIGPISRPDLTAMQSRLTEAGVASFQKSY